MLKQNVLTEYIGSTRDANLTFTLKPSDRSQTISEGVFQSAETNVSYKMWYQQQYQKIGCDQLDTDEDLRIDDIKDKSCAMDNTKDKLCEVRYYFSHGACYPRQNAERG